MHRAAGGPNGQPAAFEKGHAMIVHPSLMLIASLDEREYNAESAADVKRAFIHLAPTTVRSHPATDPAVNVMQLKVNFAKKYWLSADEGADEVWPHVKEWLAGKRYFVGENIKSFNKSRGERGEQTVDYREIDLLMAKNVVRFAVEPGAELPVFEDVAAQLRDLCNAGTFGEGPVEVCLPSAQSLAAQRAAWQAKQDEAAKQAEEQAEAAAQAAGEQPAEADQADEPSAAVEAAPTDDQAAPAADSEEQPAETPAVEPLVIDYSVWGVVAADGCQREFDSAKGAWL